MTASPFIETIQASSVGRQRYDTLLDTLRPLQPWLANARVLDFGASMGLSLFAVLELGARSAVGVEPDAERVATGKPLLANSEFSDRAELHHVADTTRLPFPDAEFDVVLCNAVLEHIPQPRHAYIAEMWRLVKPNGLLIVNETPNKYLPYDAHTTQLWLVPWLPRAVAHRYAMARHRWRAERTDWSSSGWRGLGFYELVQSTPGYQLIPETARSRHRIFSRLGLPASLLDPYPTWLLRKAG